MKQSQPFWRRRLLKPFLALLALNAAVFGVYTLPRAIQERSLESQVVVARQEVERQRRQTEELERRADTLRSNRADVERFYREVVGARESALVATLQSVVQMASEPGLKAGSRSIQKEAVKGAPLVRFSITQPVEGSYSQLVAFLDELERSPHFVTVDEVRIREKGGEAAGVAALDVDLSAYFKASEVAP
jgi:Tfp pilus assembly protein PilO